MQDRFRFRVWNKLFNTMTYNFMFGNFMQKSLEDYEKKDWVGLNYEPDYICYNNKAIEDNLVIMQCTGLKDKNGKLIYEGDIVERDHIQGKKQGVVVFDKEALQFRATNMSLYSFKHRSVVIGNIYENSL